MIFVNDCVDVAINNCSTSSNASDGLYIEAVYRYNSFVWATDEAGSIHVNSSITPDAYERSDSVSCEVDTRLEKADVCAVVTVDGHVITAARATAVTRKPLGRVTAHRTVVSSPTCFQRVAVCHHYLWAEQRLMITYIAAWWRSFSWKQIETKYYFGFKDKIKGLLKAIVIFVEAFLVFMVLLNKPLIWIQF